jgi:cytochrome c-L
MRFGVAGLAVCLGLLVGANALPADPARPSHGVVFRHIVDDAPLDVAVRPNEPMTEAVKHFHATGEDLYVGKSEAIAEGGRHYETWCQSCHLPDGSGWIGSSLISDRYNYERTKTDVGLFEIIFAGGTGAMQPFRERLTQDEILKVIAYLHSLKR